jgi:hemolysin D
MSENSKRIAEIDSQITKIILDNDKRLAETDSQIIQAQQTLTYQDITAPIAGTVFDLKAALGYVTSSANAATPVFKIVPDEALIAKVYITNKDIGFVREGMPVDVRVDSFPFSEFGDVKGTLVSVGSDALPPDQIYNFYRFPAKIKMDRQNLVVNGREISLQSGMSVSGNIKLRKRSVISIFSDLFSTKVDSLQNVR